MRQDASNFAALNEADAKRPRFVAAIIYDLDSLYITSHAGIAGVPGTVIEGALNEPTVTSQKLNPDEGTAQIGAASFGIVDLGANFTSEIRERLRDGVGLRGRQVRFFLGYEGLAFGEFVLIGTQVVQSATYGQARYTVQCLDIQRTLRTDIFNIVQTTLAASVGAADATITLTSTTGLQRLAHGTSYSDAPNATVGYVKIKSEIIRYDDIAGNQLIGCARGVFGTAPAAYAVDPATPADRRERVTEYVYLELPAVKLAYALLTGKLWGSLDTLPSGWHMGVDPALVTDEDFTGVGSDLWNPADDAVGFVVRFEGLAKTDGKRFLEKEIYLLTGTYSPVYADGTLGLRRMVRLSEDAATVATLDESNSVQVGDLQHDMESLHNLFEVNWSWNGQEFRRSTAYADIGSKQVHGEASVLALNFKGLHGARHTDGVIFQMLDMVRDRYAGPPLRLTVQPRHGLNRIEVGDVVRVRYQHVRDFSALGDSVSVAINRAFEVQSVSTDHRNGRVSLELFGSTANASVEAPTAATTSLPNAYYTSEGTELSAAPGMTIVGGVLVAASFVLSGGAVLTDAPSIFYYDGNLTIAAGITLRIGENVQLRVRGFLTVNGAIDGVGRGHAGVSDDGRALLHVVTASGVAAESIPGLPGYVGTSRGNDGVWTEFARNVSTYPPALTTGRYAVAPRLLLAIAGTTLQGLPADLRGTGGGPGGRSGYYHTPGWADSVAPWPVGLRGGAGANGGAGLLIVCRGMGFGESGFIDLSGVDSAVTVGEIFTDFPGAGGGGGPGTLYVLLDGGNLSVPDFGGRFRAFAGIVPLDYGVPMPLRVGNASSSLGTPVAGFLDPDLVTNSGQNLSGSAFVVQHVPSVESVFDDEAAANVPPAPDGITTEPIEQGINVFLSLPPLDQFDSVELYASIDNNRANAAKIAEGMFDSFRYRTPDGATRFFWARTKREGIRSAFYPTSATAGILGDALGGLRTRGYMEVFGTSARKLVGKPGSTGTYDSDFFSNETYAGGVFVSFQPVSLNAALMVGLNSDPETDSNYTSLDYAWALDSAANLSTFESGANVGNFGSYTALTVLEIRYDGQHVTYYKNGVAVRTVPKLDGVFFIDSSFATTGASIKNIKFGPLTTAPSIPWVARGNCVANATGATKVDGVNAWDSDVYSFEAHRHGAFVSFQANSTSGAVMLGLTTDPTLDQSYVSIDFAWYAAGDGNCYIYESGALGLLISAYTTDTVFAIAYDGKTVRYLKNGVLAREVYAPDRTFYMDASFNAPGTTIRNLTFTPYGSATPVPFLSRGNVIVSDTTAQKVGGTNAWDSDFVSINGYAVAFIEFKVSQTDSGLMVGLNSDPYSDQSYMSIDAAWYAEAGGTLSIYESGALVGSYGAYTTSTTLAVTYDGTDFRYYKDGNHVHTASLGSGLTVFADSSFALPGAAINSLRFGPGTILTQIDTPQLRPNATTLAIVQAQSTAMSNVPGPTLFTTMTDIISVSFTTGSEPGEAKITVSCSLSQSTFEGGGALTYAIIREIGPNNTRDKKRVIYVPLDATFSFPGLPVACMMSCKLDVAPNTVYDFALSIDQRPTGSKAACGVIVTDKLIRAEVNLR